MKDLPFLPKVNDLPVSNVLDCAYPLIRDTNPNSIKVKNIKINKNNINLIAGPCSVESEEMIHKVGLKLKQEGVCLIRGGAYKPSTSPYGFQGLGEVALRWLKDVGDAYRLGVVTEILDVNHIESLLKYADLIQVGTRNMYNYELLKELGKCNKPILLKRGMSARIEEWLLAAEYIIKEGNDQIIFCERGIRTFETYTRNTLDLNAVPILKELTSFPVIVDPSHGTGKRSLVRPMSLAALAAGADGLLIEIHPNPEQALKDGNQSLNFKEFEELTKEVRDLSHFLKRPLYEPLN